MKTKKFSEALGNVEDKYVEEAINYSSIKKYRKIGLWAMAVCIIFVVGKVMIDGIGMGTNAPTYEKNEMQLRTDGKLLYYTNLKEENKWYSYDVETGKSKKVDADINMNDFDGESTTAYITEDNILCYENDTFQIEAMTLPDYKVIVVGESICVVFYDCTGQTDEFEITSFSLYKEAK